MTIRKPRSITLLDSTSTKHHSHSIRRYITTTPKLPNIATVFEPTVYSGVYSVCVLSECMVLTCACTVYASVCGRGRSDGHSGDLVPCANQHSHTTIQYVPHLTVPSSCLGTSIYIQ